MSNPSSIQSRTIAELVSRIADRLDDQSLILALLYFSELDGGSYDFSSLAAALGRPRATVRRGLEPLLAAGCIETQADPADRRRTTLRLSPVGRRQAQRYLDQLSGVILPILERRDRAKPRRALPRRTEAIGLDHATPLIRKVFEWAKTEPSSVPLPLMDRLFIVEPDRGNFANSTFRHWGSGVWRQIDGEVPTPKKVGDAISRQSLDFYRLTLDQYDQARNAPSMHVVEVEVILPDGSRHYDIYQRIAIYHPAVGIISCPDFISWSPRKPSS